MVMSSNKAAMVLEQVEIGRGTKHFLKRQKKPPLTVPRLSRARPCDVILPLIYLVQTVKKQTVQS